MSAFRLLLTLVFFYGVSEAAETAADLDDFDIDVLDSSAFRDGTVAKKTAYNSTFPEFSKTADKDGGSLEEMLKVYDTRAVAQAWHKHEGLLSLSCRQDMHSFLMALDRSELWALKGKFPSFPSCTIHPKFWLLVIFCRVREPPFILAYFTPMLRG